MVLMFLVFTWKVLFLFRVQNYIISVHKRFVLYISSLNFLIF